MPNGSQNFNQSVYKNADEGGEKPMITGMHLEKICELGKKHGVINTENEGMELRRIRELEVVGPERVIISENLERRGE